MKTATPLYNRLKYFTCLKCLSSIYSIYITMYLSLIHDLQVWEDRYVVCQILSIIGQKYIQCNNMYKNSINS